MGERLTEEEAKRATIELAVKELAKIRSQLERMTTVVDIFSNTLKEWALAAEPKEEEIPR